MESDADPSDEYPCGTKKVKPPPTYLNAYEVSSLCNELLFKSIKEIPLDKLVTTTTPSPYLCAPHK